MVKVKNAEIKTAINVTECKNNRLAKILLSKTHFEYDKGKGNFGQSRTLSKSKEKV